MTTLLWFAGVSAQIAFGLLCYLKGRDAEREWIAGQCNVLEQDLSQALFQRDIARWLLGGRVKSNANLRKALVESEREKTKLRQDILDLRVALDKTKQFSRN